MRLSRAGLLVLKVCLERHGESLYGYELMQKTGVASGTLYPLLLRFENEGLLESEWESVDSVAVGRPRRRLYRITADGVRAASAALLGVQVGMAT